MDRANLEALTEEAEDDSKPNRREDDDSSDSDDDGDGGVRGEEPNKFEGLCDGVLNSLALVHASMGEMLSLKDELLKHALPPNVLVQIALSTTKVFRSISDMHMPINELVRLVRLYSTPWEEKSAALQKLHEDYESKKNQLNIAVKRLEMIDAHSKRIARERRIMNWEKLFSRLTSTRGHGRRWKFLIESFKRKAAEGIGPLQAYVDAMERKADSDNEEENEYDKDIDTQMAQMTPTPSEERRQHLQLPKEEETTPLDEETESEEEDDTPVEVIQVPTPVIKEVPVYVKPPSQDAEVWTHEPEYSRQLHLRVYKPEGLEYRELRCVLSCGGKQHHKTEPLDIELVVEDDKKEDDKKSEDGESEKPKSAESGSSKRKASKGRLIGSRVGGKAGGLLLHEEEILSKERPPPRYEEVTFKMPDEVKPGIWKPKDVKETVPSTIRIAVHQGSHEELIAMASIEIEDLESLELPAVYVPESNDDGNTMPDSDSSPITVDPPAQFKDTDATHFPLFPIIPRVGESASNPCGQVPIACYWSKIPKPRVFHKLTESESVNDIVYDVTGFDMNVLTKEDLHKEYVDECLSVPRFTPERELIEEPKEETVLRSDYDRMQQSHREEMETVTDEYEERIAELVTAMQQMQVALENEAQKRLQEALEAERNRPRTPATAGETPHPPPPRAKTITTVPMERPKKPVKTAKSAQWGKDLPEDFFERLALFELQHQQHQQELQERVGKEVSQRIEKNLAGEFKIANPEDQEIYDALKDVSLPAVFMPSKSNNMTIFNPRAHNYFHKAGGTARLTQPPSMIQLPPIPQNKMSVCNLFDLSRNFQQPGGQEWLMQRYLHTQIAKQQMRQEQGQQKQQQLDNPTPLTPAPTYSTQTQMLESTYQPTRAREISAGSGRSRGGGPEMD